MELRTDLGLQLLCCVRFNLKNREISIKFFADAASGTSVDFMYGNFGTKLAYTYEFRNRQYSFLLPPEFIIPNAEEILDSIVGMVARARVHGFLQVAA